MQRQGIYFLFTNLRRFRFYKSVPGKESFRNFTLFKLFSQTFIDQCTIVSNTKTSDAAPTTACIISCTPTIREHRFPAYHVSVISKHISVIATRGTTTSTSFNTNRSYRVSGRTTSCYSSTRGIYRARVAPAAAISHAIH